MMSEKRENGKEKKNLKENTMFYEEFDWMEMLNEWNTSKTACMRSGRIHRPERWEGHDILGQAQWRFSNFHSHCRARSPISEPKFKISTPPPSPLLISDKSLM